MPHVKIRKESEKKVSGGWKDSKYECGASILTWYATDSSQLPSQILS